MVVFSFVSRYFFFFYYCVTYWWFSSTVFSFRTVSYFFLWKFFLVVDFRFHRTVVRKDARYDFSLLGLIGCQILSCAETAGHLHIWWGPDVAGCMVSGGLVLVLAHWWLDLDSRAVGWGSQEVPELVPARWWPADGWARSLHSWLWSLGTPRDGVCGSSESRHLPLLTSGWIWPQS